MIGAYFLCALTANYAYYFSAPVILQEATGWSVTNVGFLIAGFGLAGAAGMLLNGAHSDRSGERTLHCVIPCIIMGAGYLTASYARTPWLIVASLGMSFVAFMSMQGPALAVPTQFLAGRAAAAGIAAMNMITMFSGFIGPYWMGGDERCDRQLLAGPARPRRAKPRRCARHVPADAQPRPNVRDGTDRRPRQRVGAQRQLLLPERARL